MNQQALSFAALLKTWRGHRKISQLHLAMESGISQRHISFLETGRSNPSRRMVVQLCESLDVPLRERNMLLASAGFAPLYEGEALDHESLTFFKDALATAIQHHEPYPAVVIDGQWNLSMANESALRFFGLFFDPLTAFSRYEDFQILRLCLDEEALAGHIENLPELMRALLLRVRRASAANPGNERLQRFLGEVSAHPEIAGLWDEPASAPVNPVIEMTLKLGEARFRLFTMLAHFGSPEHVTLEELSVETFYPADAATKQHFLTTAAASPAA